MFRQKQFILSSSILGLVIFISLVASFYPGKTPVKEVAGVKQSLSVTPTKIQSTDTASSSAEMKTESKITPSVTKTQSSSGSLSQPNTVSSAQDNNSSSISSTPTSMESNNTDSQSTTQTSGITPTPSEVLVTKTNLTISGNWCSNDINAVCPTPTSRPGVGSSNTATLISMPTPTPSNTGGDVTVQTGQAVTDTP